MRIDDLNRTPVTQGAEKPETEPGKRPVEGNHAGAPGTDQVEVSNLAQALSSGDPHRLEKLRVQVESGTYSISAAELARSIVHSHLKE